jgi:hypothetical protein
MFDAGLVQMGDTPNSEELPTYMRRLNKMVNYFMIKGIKLFVQEDYALQAPILQQGVGGQGNPYTFGPGGMVNMAKPRRCTDAYYTDSNANRRPLICMSRNEWDNLSTTTTQGTVTSFYADKQLATLNIYLWLVPDATAATGAVHLILDEQINNFAMLTDAMAFPPEWSLALEWGLADQISTGQPASVIENCKVNAQFYREELEGWDVEDASTSFAPDQRGQFVGRRIRY